MSAKDEWSSNESAMAEGWLGGGDEETTRRKAGSARVTRATYYSVMKDCSTLMKRWMDIAGEVRIRDELKWCSDNE